MELRYLQKGSVSYGLGGRPFSPSLSCRGQGIGKQRGTISSGHKRTAGRNLVVHRHCTTLRQSVQRYRCRLYFSLFFSHFVFDIKAGKSPEDIVRERSVSFMSLVVLVRIVDGYCVEYIGGFARLSLSLAMKRENFPPFKQVCEWSTGTKTKTNSLYMHISYIYEDMTRFRRHLLLTQNGMTFSKCYS